MFNFAALQAQIGVGVALLVLAIFVVTAILYAAIGIVKYNALKEPPTKKGKAYEAYKTHR